MRRYRKPYRIKKRGSIFKNRFFWLGILILIIFFGIFYLICFSPFFQIKEIKISGNEKVLTEDLENVIWNQTARNLIFFQTKSIFLVNSEKIKEIILEKFPLLYYANFKRKFPDTLIIKVEERKPIAIFCQDNCFFLDKEGVIFETVTTETPQLLKIQNQEKDRESKLGKKVIEKELLSQILKLGEKLNNDFKIPLKEILLISDENILAKTFEGWQIYFNPKGNIFWQLTKLNALLEKEIPQEKRKKLEYIDLRFGNFAPYKYRD